MLTFLTAWIDCQQNGRVTELNEKLKVIFVGLWTVHKQMVLFFVRPIVTYLLHIFINFVILCSNLDIVSFESSEMFLFVL